MTTSAKIAHGTKLKRVSTEIAEITKIEGMELERAVVDVTNTDSGGWLEKIPGLKEAKEIKIEGNFRPDDSTGQIQMYTDFGAGTVSTWTISGPTTLAFSWTFDGWVKGLSINAPVAESKPATFSATICISGAAVLAYSASDDITTIAMGTGTLSPGYVATTYTYTVDLAASTTSTFTVTKDTSVLKLYVAGVYTASLTTTEASAAIPFAIGTTKVEISCTDTGKVPKWYTIYVSRSS